MAVSEQSTGPMAPARGAGDGEPAASPLDRILAQTSSVAQLDQICGALGWGRRFAYEGGAGWFVEVTCGLGDVIRVETRDHHPRTNKGEKAGKIAASLYAVSALKERVEAAFAREPVLLEDAFGKGQAPEVLESTSASWTKVWSALEGRSDDGRVVGVSTGGNDGSGPPVLVQVATEDLVVLELPRSRKNGLSKNLRKFLADETVTKVFCDSAANRDILSLGLTPETPGVLNLDKVAKEHFGQPAAQRGLARIAGLVLGARVDKGGGNCMQEFEKSTASSIEEFSETALRYAAMEARASLQVWRALRSALDSHEAKPPKVVVRDMKEGEALEDENIDDEIANLERRLFGADGGAPPRATKKSGRRGVAQPSGEEDAEDLDDEIAMLERQLQDLDGEAGGDPEPRPPAEKRRKKGRGSAANVDEPPVVRGKKKRKDKA